MDYASIGRYHVATGEARALVAKRNGILARVAMVAQNAAALPAGGQGIGKRCNYPALAGLLTEAEALDTQLAILLAEINDLAPLADQPPLTLA